MIVFEAQFAVTPGGNPVTELNPSAPVVIWVIGDNALLMQIVGVDDGALIVFSGLTRIVPVAFIVPHPPVSGML